MGQLKVRWGWAGSWWPKGAAALCASASWLYPLRQSTTFPHDVALQRYSSSAPAPVVPRKWEREGGIEGGRRRKRGKGRGEREMLWKQWVWWPVVCLFKSITLHCKLQELTFMVCFNCTCSTATLYMYMLSACETSQFTSHFVVSLKLLISTCSRILLSLVT